MRIGELAAATKVTAHTLRFWERRGLLPDPGRTSGGYRSYSPEAIERVTFVRRARSAGLTLDQIKTVLEVYDHGRRPCPQVAAFVDEPALVTAKQMDRWAHDFDNWATCDTLCFKLFDRTPHAFGRISRWSSRRREFERRAAFALLASVALHDRVSLPHACRSTNTDVRRDTALKSSRR